MGCCNGASLCGLLPSERTNAAMCVGCKGAKDGPRTVVCSVGGRPLAAYIAGAAACPLGRHADAKGRVKWLGARWIGCPKPRRWWLVWKGLMSKAEAALLPECGCVAALKAVWTRVFGRHHPPYWVPFR